MTSRDRLLAICLPVLWGFNFVVLAWGMGSGDNEVPPLLFAALRFAVVVPAVLFVPRPKAPFTKVAAIGVFMLLGQYGLLYTSMAVGMPAGLASLVLQVQVPLTIVIASASLREKPTVVQIVGVTIGALGLAIVGAGRGGHIPLTALFLCLAAGLSWAIGNVLARALRVPGGLSLTVWSSTVVPVPLVLLAVAVDGPGVLSDGVHAFGWKAGVSTVYTVVLSTLVGFAIFNSLLARHSSSTVVPWILMVPIVGITTAWLCLGEVPNTAELVGGACTIVGVLVAQGVLRRRTRAVIPA